MINSTRKRPGYFLAWVDLLYGQLATFVFLFILSVVLINPPAVSKPGVELKAEYMIRMEWPQGNFDDIDIHLKLPSGGMLNFRSKEVEHTFLDHDDIGINNTFVINSKPVFKEHQETIAIRAVIPGTYVVNVHVYRSNSAHVGVDSNPSLPFSVKTTLTKLNPVITEVTTRSVVVSEVGEQKTVFCFTIDTKGEVSIDVECDVPFVPLRKFGETPPALTLPSEDYGRNLDPITFDKK